MKEKTFSFQSLWERKGGRGGYDCVTDDLRNSVRDFTIFSPSLFPVISFYCLKHIGKEYRRFNLHYKRKTSGNAHN